MKISGKPRWADHMDSEESEINTTQQSLRKVQYITRQDIERKHLEESIKWSALDVRGRIELSRGLTNKQIIPTQPAPSSPGTIIPAQAGTSPWKKLKDIEKPVSIIQVQAEEKERIAREKAAEQEKIVQEKAVEQESIASNPVQIVQEQIVQEQIVQEKPVESVESSTIEDTWSVSSKGSNINRSNMLTPRIVFTDNGAIKLFADDAVKFPVLVLWCNQAKGTIDIHEYPVADRIIRYGLWKSVDGKVGEYQRLDLINTRGMLIQPLKICMELPASRRMMQQDHSRVPIVSKYVGFASLEDADA